MGIGARSVGGHAGGKVGGHFGNVELGRVQVWKGGRLPTLPVFWCFSLLEFWETIIDVKLDMMVETAGWGIVVSSVMVCKSTKKLGFLT